MLGQRSRLLRLVPATLAAYELRRLISVLVTAVGRAGSAHGSAVALILGALMAGLLLRESARGLNARFPRVAWSATLIATWLLCSAAVATMLGCVGLVGHGLASADWAGTVPGVLAAGLLLAVSVRGGAWLLQDRCGLSPPLEFSLLGPLRLHPGAPARRVAAPLRAGSSGRGPPRAALAVR